MKKVLITISILILIAAVFIGYITLKGNGNFNDLSTTTVEKGEISQSVIATGKIEPLSEIEIKSKIGGIISKLYVEEGDRVAKGQKIAEISPGATPMELVNARNEVKRAFLEKENARFLFEQGERLKQKKLISDKEYKNLEVMFQTATTRFYSAMAKLQIFEKGKALSELEESFNLTAEDKEAIRKETEEVLKSMVILAPIDGIVLSRDQDEGTAVIPISSAYGGTVIMKLADVSEMHFKGDVDEADIGDIYYDQPVKVYVDAYKDKVFDGELYHISPLGREKENIVNFEVKVKIKDPEKLLKVGMSADAKIIVEEKTDILVIPESYIMYNDDKASVYLFDETKETGKRKVDIEIGISDGTNTEILEGLKEGDKVVYPE